ncbi:rho GTPase-activating protein 29 [Erythrolamprus reginae]|uniref:rho GTPase-activating protein 29 n=1 Tax=Erythrolamprus reginae TaxID=121349 RepID=UPI00396CA26F
MLRQNGDSNKHGLGLTELSTSFPISSTGTSGMGRSIKSSFLSNISSNINNYNSMIVDPVYILQMVTDVRKFADALLHLREAINSENQSCLHQIVHGRLGEVLRVLKAIINKHPNLYSVDVLSAAGTVIAKVRAVNFKEINEEKKREILNEIHSSIDLLAFNFGNAVSDFLMGDVDNGSRLGLQISRQSQSFENICTDSGISLHESIHSTGHRNAEEIESALLRNNNGIKSALSYAKAWSKYVKDIVVWVEKKINLEMECAKNLAKVAETTKTIIVSQDYMPFQSIFISAFQNDIENSLLSQQTAVALQTNKFIQPLVGRKNELDKQRKEIKELWQREEKKLQELESSVRKAKQLYLQRHEEYEKARSTTLREDDYISSNWAFTKEARKLEKKRKLELEALQKVEEANEHFKASKAEVEEKRSDLESVILTQLQEQIYQCDLTLKAATVNLFQMQHAQVVSTPVNYQYLCESAKLYDPGKMLFEYVKNFPKYDAPTESDCFETQTSQVGGVFGEQSNNVSASQGNIPQCSGDDPIQLLDDTTSPAYLCSQKIGDKRSLSTADISAIGAPLPFRSWSVGNQSGMCSDSESAGGSSESRSASPVGDFKRFPRTSSVGTVSSAYDLDEREAPSPSDCGLNDLAAEIASTPGPFQNTLLSKAAQTHKFRKLRSPSKCRECDSLVIFHGAECEECSLSCHKKCLEILVIQCGHKKLHGKLHMFGVEFTQVSKNSEDGIPFIIRKCTSEIESRALDVTGIYRVSGVKSRVEKLCQSFENGKDLVLLSEFNAHDISNVLKLFLRQLPEPLILSRFYNEFIGLAKESQNFNGELDMKQMKPESDMQQSVCIELNRIILKIKDLLRLLPTANHNTLKFLLAHLCRVTDCDENKMSAHNLGIIFGPTLVRLRETGAKPSLSSLVDYPYQARMIELLITYYEKIFDAAQEHSSAATESDENSFCTKSILSVEAKLTSQDRKGGFSVAMKENVKRKNSTKRSVSFEEPDGSKRSSFQSDSLVKDSTCTLERKLSLSQENSPSESTPILPLENNTIPRKESDNKVTPVLDQDNGKHDLETEDGVKSDQLIRPKCHITKVQMRYQKSKPFFRPVSLPSGSMLPILNEQNFQNASLNPDKLEKSLVTEDISETQSLPSTNAGCRISRYDPQTQKKTWEKQCKQYDMTSKATKIMTNINENLIQDSVDTCALNASSNLVSNSVNAILLDSTCTLERKLSLSQENSPSESTPILPLENNTIPRKESDSTCTLERKLSLSQENSPSESTPVLPLENNTIPRKESDNKVTPVLDQDNGKHDLETEDGVKSDQLIRPKCHITKVQMRYQKSKPFFHPVSLPSGSMLPILNEQNFQNASLNPDKLEKSLVTEDISETQSLPSTNAGCRISRYDPQTQKKTLEKQCKQYDMTSKATKIMTNINENLIQDSVDTCALNASSNLVSNSVNAILLDSTCTLERKLSLSQENSPSESTPVLPLEKNTIPRKESDNKVTPVLDQDNGKHDLETEDGVKSDQLIRPKRHITKVQMRCQKSKPFFRPVSLPLGSMLPISNEQNFQNASLNPDKLEKSLVTEDISETQSLPSTNAGCRISRYDPQTQKKTLEKQCKQYDMTSKATKIMTNINENLIQDSVDTCALNASSNLVSNSVNAILLDSTCTLERKLSLSQENSPSESTPVLPLENNTIPRKESDNKVTPVLDQDNGKHDLETEDGVKSDQLIRPKCHITKVQMRYQKSKPFFRPVSLPLGSMLPISNEQNFQNASLNPDKLEKSLVTEDISETQSLPSTNAGCRISRYDPQTQKKTLEKQCKQYDMTSKATKIMTNINENLIQDSVDTCALNASSNLVSNSVNAILLDSTCTLERKLSLSQENSPSESTPVLPLENNTIPRKESDNKVTPVLDQDNGKHDLETEDGVKSDQLIRPKCHITKVQMRYQKSKPFFRPVSLPLGSMLPISNEQNFQNASLNPDKLEKSLVTEDISETQSLPSTNAGCRISRYDPQTQKKTLEKQCKQYDMTSKATKIMTNINENLIQDSVDTCALNASSNLVSNSVNAILLDNKVTPVLDQDNGKHDLETEDGVKSDQLIRPKCHITKVQMRYQKSKPFFRPVSLPLGSMLPISNEQNFQNASLNPDKLEKSLVTEDISETQSLPSTNAGCRISRYDPQTQKKTLEKQCKQYDMTSKATKIMTNINENLIQDSVDTCALNASSNLVSNSVNAILLDSTCTLERKLSLSQENSPSESTPVLPLEKNTIPRKESDSTCTLERKLSLSQENSPSESTPVLPLEHNTIPRKESDNKVTPVLDQDNGKHDLETEDGVKSDQLIRPKRHITKVQMRYQKSKPFFRPVSLPLGSMLPISNEQNFQNASLNPDKLEKSLVTEDISETQSLPSTNAGCRISRYDPQTQKKTWEKQCKQYDMTSKATKIMTNINENLIQDSVDTCALNASSNLVSNSVNAILLGKPYTGPATTVKPVGEAHCTASTSVVTLKKPRCFQPPGGTFYSPSSNNNAKPNDESSASKCYTAIIQNDMPEQGVNPGLDHRVLDSSSQYGNQPKPTGSFETISPADLKPAHQRLRPKRMQELEDREAHFV